MGMNIFVSTFNSLTYCPFNMQVRISCITSIHITSLQLFSNLWFWCLSSISFCRLLSGKYNNTENLSKHHRERLRVQKHKISDNAWTKIFKPYLDLFDVTFISTLTLLVTNRISLSDLKFFASLLSSIFEEPFVSGCGWSFNHMIYFFD